jgi:hypothetical protein
MKRTNDRAAEDRANEERGQAFTLEGFVASVVLLTAVLLAQQSVVLTPTTGGIVDDDQQQELRAQARDVLAVTAGNVSGGSGEVNRDLSYVLRFWNGTENTWAYAENVYDQPGGGYVGKVIPNQETVFGNALNGTFNGTDTDFNYKIIVEHPAANASNGTERFYMKFQETPDDDAVTVSRTVTLFDDDTLTGVPGASANFTDGPCTDRPLTEISDTFNPNAAGRCFYPIPEAKQFEDSPIYNVVEIRLVVWSG